MTVRKITIIAIVFILAVPILLGYAFNLSETTETDYKATGEAVNVTPLLQNDTGYSYAHGDIYQNNTNFYAGNIKQYPVYTINSSKSTFKGNITAVTGHNVLPGSGPISLHYPLLYYQADYTPSVGYVTMNFQTELNGVYTPYSVAKFHSANYNADDGKWYVSYYTSDTTIAYTSYSNFYSVTGFTATSGYTGYMYVLYDHTIEQKYVNFSAGYQFHNVFGHNSVVLPNYTHDVLFTVNLNSITDANYSLTLRTFGIGYIFTKTTVGGNVQWQIIDEADPTIYQDLYYDPSRSDNTYQIKITYDKLYDDASLSYYKQYTEARYVGSWPTLIGEANYYQDYSLEKTVSYPIGTPVNFHLLDFISDTKNYPTMRVDDTLFRAFEYPVISNQEYRPADFRQNPVTTISNTTQYGTSLQFGGNTYAVSDGKITLNGHDIPVNGLTLSSMINDDGDYENKIGNTLISTTAQPSTITFNGIWAASVNTQSMELYNYTKTEWHAGEFAWDGIDQNFLIVGLITCLGVFVGLGIYARKSRSGGIIPLMIVTGCAAAVFFIML